MHKYLTPNGYPNLAFVTHCLMRLNPDSHIVSINSYPLGAYGTADPLRQTAAVGILTNRDNYIFELYEDEIESREVPQHD